MAVQNATMVLERTDRRFCVIISLFPVPVRGTDCHGNERVNCPPPLRSRTLGCVYDEVTISLVLFAVSSVCHDCIIIGG